MTRLTRYRLLLVMTAGCVYGLLGIASVLGQFATHGVIDPDTVARVIAAFLIECLAYEAYVVRRRVDDLRLRLRRATEVAA